MRCTAPLMNPWLSESPTVTNRWRAGTSGLLTDTGTPSVGSVSGRRGSAWISTSGGIGSRTATAHPLAPGLWATAVWVLGDPRLYARGTDMATGRAPGVLRRRA